MKRLALILTAVLALPVLAQTPTPTPSCVICCTPTPTPTPGDTPAWTPTPSAPTPTATPSPTTTPSSPTTPTPVPSAGACSLSSAPVPFEPNPPGAPRPSTLSGGFSSFLKLYQAPGQNRRILLQESFGYSLLDLANPMNPVALYYHDTRFPLGGGNSLAGRPDVGGYGGDGQSDVYASAVSDDGQRLVQSLGGPADGWYTVVGSASAQGFTLWGSFTPNRANSVLVQHVGPRYIAYTFSAVSTAQDVTVLPTSFTPLNMQAETTGWPDGGASVLAGNFIVYASVLGITVIDASLPGPPGAITAGMPRTIFSAADFGNRPVMAMTAAIDPANPARVWVLVELKQATGENSPSYALASVTAGVKVVKPFFRVPASLGERYAFAGTSAALVPQGTGLVVLMWSQRISPSPTAVRVYSTTVAGWGAPTGVLTLPTTVLSGHPVGAFAAGKDVYVYSPQSVSAYAVHLVCQ